MNRNIISFVVATAILMFTVIMPPMFGLTESAQRTLGVLCFGLILWILEVMPLSITAILVIILQPILNIVDVNTAFANWARPVTFFVLATYGISAAITSTNLGKRLIVKLLRLSGNDSKKIILAFMVATAILSAIMSNVPVTALFAGIAVGILNRMGKEKKDLAFGKLIMIAIPFAGMIGGAMTPAGSSINVLALDLLQSYSGIQVGFVDWMVYGVPFALLMLPICWYILIKIYKPNDVKLSIIEGLINDDEIPDKFCEKEKKVLSIIIVIITLWILSTWVPILNTTVVACAGLIMFFMPGINVFTWEQFSKGVSWNAVIMIGGVLSIGSAAEATGLGQWFLELFINYFLQLHIMVLLLLLGIIIVLLHFPLPMSPAIVAVGAVPLYELSVQMNLSPELLIIPLAIFSICCMIIPLDPVPLITYSYGYYSMKEYIYIGAVCSLFWVITLSIWVPIAGRILNVY